MGETIIITGGCRSGKSGHALQLAESIGAKRLYIATAKVTDDEMEQRIRRHQEERKKGGWDTVEEPVNLAQVLDSIDKYNVALVDCLTIWVSNVMYEASTKDEVIDEDNISELCREILDVATKTNKTVIFVTNEVGMGIVPDNTLARNYRDIIGRCNQVMASGADRVEMVVSGIPLKLK